MYCDNLDDVKIAITMPYVERDSCKYFVILSNENCNQSIFEWKYKIRTPTHRSNPKLMIEVATWADENLIGDYLFGASISGFEKKEDMFKFILAWV